MAVGILLNNAPLLLGNSANSTRQPGLLRPVDLCTFHEEGRSGAFQGDTEDPARAGRRGPPPALKSWSSSRRIKLICMRKLAFRQLNKQRSTYQDGSYITMCEVSSR